MRPYTRIARLTLLAAAALLGSLFDSGSDFGRLALAADPSVAARAKRLLVVAPSRFRDSLAPFVSHKAPLLPTEIVDLETVLEKSQGADDAEKLKRYLYGRWKKQRIGYVLLVGDAEVMPVRYAAVHSYIAGSGDWGFAPSDLYYGNLAKKNGSFDDWHANKNRGHPDYYGEIQGYKGESPINLDQISYLPQVAVGRWPVHTIAQLQTIVAKTIRYENHILADDLPATHRAAFINGPNLVDVRDKMDDWNGQLNSAAHVESVRLYYQDDKRQASAPALSAAAVAKIFNDGAGMIFYVGHGSERGWAGCLNVKQLKSLNNAELPPVLVTASCSTAAFGAMAPYQPYLDIHGKEHPGTKKETFTEPAPPPNVYQPEKFDRHSLGTDFLRSSPNGAVAYIGCNMVAQAFAWPMVKSVIDYDTSHREPRLGDAWNAALTEYYHSHHLDTIQPHDWVQSATFHQGMKFQLFGDPSLRLPR